MNSIAHDPAASVVQAAPPGNDPPVAEKVTTSPAWGAGPAPSSRVTVAATPTGISTGASWAGPTTLRTASANQAAAASATG